MNPPSNFGAIPRATRAAVFHAPDRPLEIVEIPIPPPEPDRILVRVEACALCASDRHTRFGRRGGKTPIILGHEIVGRIAGFGPDAPRADARGAPIELGDRVTWSIAASCGTCFPCVRGIPQKCDALFKYGHEPIEAGGPPSGGLAEHLVLQPGTTIVRVSEDLPAVVAASINCAGATAAAALRLALRNSEVRSTGPPSSSTPETLLVLGCGALGLHAIAQARSRPCPPRILAADILPDRLVAATRLGAEAAEPVGSVALRAALERMTDGRGADASIDFTGSTAVVEEAVDLARVGGIVALVGAVAPDRPLAIRPETIVRRMLTLAGLHNYRPDDLLAAVDALDAPIAESLDAELRGETFPLNRVDEAFERAEARPGRRALVVPD